MTIRELIAEIEAFRDTCAVKEYTDTTEAWRLLENVTAALESVAWVAETTTYEAALILVSELNTAETRDLLAVLQEEDRITTMNDRAFELRQQFDEGDHEPGAVLEAISLARDMIAEFGHAETLMGGYEAFDDWAADLADWAREERRDVEG